MNLVVPSFSLMCIFQPAFWPSSVQSLVLSACEAQNLLVLGSPEERLLCSRSSLDAAKNGQTNLILISGSDPPKIHQPGPKIHCKTYQQIRLSNLQVGLGASSARRAFLDWQEGLLLEASSEHGFWDTLLLPSGHGRGSRAEMHLQSLRCCWWERQALLRTLPDNTFYSKAFIWSKQPKNNKNNAWMSKQNLGNLVSHARIPPKNQGISYRMHGFPRKT